MVNWNSEIIVCLHSKHRIPCKNAFGNCTGYNQNYRTGEKCFFFMFFIQGNDENAKWMVFSIFHIHVLHSYRFCIFPFQLVGLHCLLHYKNNHRFGITTCVHTKSKVLQVTNNNQSTEQKRRKKTFFFSLFFSWKIKLKTFA